MYAAFDNFERNPRPTIVPPWFLRFVAPLLLLLALPLALIVLALTLGVLAARALFNAFQPRPTRPRADADGVLTDVDYVVVDVAPEKPGR